MPLLAVLSFQPAAQQITFGSQKLDLEPARRALLAPEDERQAVRALYFNGEAAKAYALVQTILKSHPGDYDLRHIGFEAAFVLGRYDELEGLTHLTPEELQRYPDYEFFARATSDWMVDGGLAVAAYSGVKVNRDRTQLDRAVMHQALAHMDSLPVEMVTEDGINTKPAVVALTLLMPTYGQYSRVLLKRIVAIAPTDTFVLELQARDFQRQQIFAKQVEYLKKAMKAPKVTKDRKKALEGLLKEAEKMAAYQKIIGPPTNPPPPSAQN
jgi:hypothetical protein